MGCRFSLEVPRHWKKKKKKKKYIYIYIYMNMLRWKKHSDRQKSVDNKSMIFVLFFTENKT